MMHRMKYLVPVALVAGFIVSVASVSRVHAVGGISCFLGLSGSGSTVDVSADVAGAGGVSGDVSYYGGGFSFDGESIAHGQGSFECPGGSCAVSLQGYAENGGYCYRSKTSAPVRSGRPLPQCSDGQDNDGDGLYDYDGAGRGAPDPGCGGDPNFNDESADEGKSPTWIDVTVTSNMQDAGWQFSSCPRSPYNGNGVDADCGVTYHGSQSMNDLANSGTYTLVAENVPGYRVSVNGVEGQAASETAAPKPGRVVPLAWTIEYVKENSNPSGITLRTNKSVAAPGDPITVSWNNQSGLSHATDWIAMVPAGGSWSDGWAWAYCNGTKTTPGSPCPATGSLTFTAPSGVSAIQFVYYRNGTFTEAARSPHVTIGASGSVTFACAALTPGAVWSGTKCIVPSGQYVALRWDAPSASGCTASGAWDGGKSAQGESHEGPITAPTTFTIACTFSGARLLNHLPAWLAGFLRAYAATTASLTVEPDIALPQKTAVDLKCGTGGSYSHGPCQIPTGSNISLQWTGTNLASCTASANPASGGWSGAKPTSGTESHGPIGVQTSFTLACVGTDGSHVTDRVQVTPTHAVCSQAQCIPVPGAGTNECATDKECGGGTGACNFQANPARLVLPPPKSSTLSWDCGNVKNCRISPDLGAVDPKGTASVAPQATTVYTLSCTAQNGAPVSDQTSVRIFTLEGGALKEVVPR